MSLKGFILEKDKAYATNWFLPKGGIFMFAIDKEYVQSAIVSLQLDIMSSTVYAVND